MRDYTLTQQYIIMGMNGLVCNHASMAKSAVLFGIPAAEYLQRHMLQEKWEDVQTFKEGLIQVIHDINKMSRRRVKDLEKEAAKELLELGTLEIIPDILGCDMFYETAGVEIKAYRSDEEAYTGITEGLRAEVLEEGPLTTEAVCLLWLLRESGCLHDIFTTGEQEQLAAKLLDITTGEPHYRIIWESEFHNGLARFAVSFLKAKKNLFKNPYLEGVNILYPFLDRRQAIFIDFVVLGTSVKDRRQAVLAYLSERGHYVQEVKNGSETLLKIDNNYYRIFPKTVVCSRIPIQGANLVPVYR